MDRRKGGDEDDGHDGAPQGDVGGGGKRLSRVLLLVRPVQGDQ